jgi:hypothetical protein
MVSLQRIAHGCPSVASRPLSPEFEINDVGRLLTADEISASAEVEYRETQPGRLFRSYAVSLESDRRWNYDKELQEGELDSQVDVIWKNFWSTEFGFDLNLPAHDQRLTRGGPSMATPRGWSTSLQISNRAAAATRGSVDLEYGRNEDGATLTSSPSAATWCYGGSGGSGARSTSSGSRIARSRKSGRLASGCAIGSGLSGRRAIMSLRSRRRSGLV